MTAVAPFKLINLRTCVRGFAAKAGEPAVLGLGKKAKRLLAEGMKKKTKVEVEKDANILVSEVCGTNLLAEGGENVKIKPESEYPDWLWKMHTGPPLKLEEMDPNSKAYWVKVNYLGRKHDQFIRTMQKWKTVQK